MTYIQHIIHLSPSQIKKFDTQQSFIIDYRNIKNKKRLIVFLTKTQIKKVEKAKANKEKVDLKFSKTKFKKTFNNIIRLNNNVSKKENRKKLQLLKEENKKKLDKINKIKLKLFIKNKIEENKKNKLKPKKKKITNLINFPEINLI